MAMKIKFVIISIITVLSSVMWTMNSSATEKYIVQQGDTLWSIARKFNLKIDEILKLNDLSNPDQLQIGDHLIISNNSDVSAVSLTNDDAKQDNAFQPKIGVVLGANVNIRENPNLGSNVITVAVREAKYKILGQSGNWFQISLPNGQAGWISGDYFAESGQPASRSGGRGIIDVAFRYIGSPYRMGGTTSSGFDCSGFVRTVYASISLDLPHSSREMYKLGEKVSLAEASAGDLVFFTTYTSGPSHVGIYVGNGSFISSTSSRGVIVSSLSDAYWKARFIGIKRII